MLNITAKPIHAPNKTLGVGTYYERSGQVRSDLKDWIAVRLDRPLVVDERTARSLEHEYGTSSENPTIAMSGAWTLRRDLIRQGSDGLSAVHGDRARIVQYRGSTVEASKSDASRDQGTVIKLHPRLSGEIAAVRRPARQSSQVASP